MFLKKIRFINFKGFADLELSFEKADGSMRNQTLLLGENGTGKSNLLKGIALVTAGSNALSELIGNPDDWIYFGKKECTIEAVIQTRQQEERHIGLNIKRGYDLREIILHNEESLSKIDEALKHTERSYFAVGYGVSRRLNKGSGQPFSSAGQQAASPRRAQNMATLFNPDAVLQPLAEWAMDLDYRSGGSQLNVVKKALSEFLPDVNFHSIDKQNNVLLFKTKFDPKPVPLHLLSEGYQNVLSWIGDLLYRITHTFEDYKNPLATGGLLLVDEIDLHLHPKWQRVLLDFIEKKLPNFQLVATTHSPLTAQQADEGELYVLSREEKKMVLKPFVGSPRYMLVSQLLMSPMFGLDTDESLHVERMKEEYRELKQRGTNRRSNPARLKQLKAEIEQLPVQPLKNDVFLKQKESLIQKLSKKANIKM